MHNYIEQYKQMYAKDYNRDINSNTTLILSHLIENFIKKINGKVLLDYGSGRGIQYSEAKVHRKWGIEDIDCYDPAIEDFKKKPDYQKNYDVLICIDVLEHIPMSNIDDVLHDIFKYKFKLVIFSISTVPANAILPNGENAHVTIKPSSWWVKQIMKHNTKDIHTVIKTSNNFSQLYLKKQKEPK